MTEKTFMKSAASAAGSVVDRARGAAAAAVAGAVGAASAVKNKIFGGGAPPRDSLPNSLRGSNGYEFNEDSKPSSREEYTLNFQPNLLDNYDSYTYHWKLFITSMKDAYDGTVLNPEAQTIIAETGVTDLALEKVELNGIAVPSIQGGTGTQTTLKFQIVEPAGAALFDKMYAESLALGLGSWLVMPIFLQLEFRARDQVTSEALLSGQSGRLNDLRWVWPIKLTNSKAHVSHVGTRYDFEAIVYDELAQSNSYFSIQHNIVLENIDTFQKAIDQLKSKLDKDQEDKLMDRYSFPDVYEFVVDPLISKNARIVVPDQNQNTSRWSDYGKFENKQVSYNSGTGIDKIIDSLLGNTDYFQKKLQSSPTRTGEPDSANTADSMRQMWRIITETRAYTFDPMRQDNAVKITIYITEYNIGLIEATPPQTGQTPDTLPAAKKRMATYHKNKILNKRYDYIFTGLNDQIVQFDLNMNFSFAAALSRFNGIYYDSAGGDMGVAAQQNATLERRLSTHLSQQLKMINSAEFKGDRAAAAEALRVQVGRSAGASPETESKFNALIDKFKSGRLTVNSAFNEALSEENRKRTTSLAPPNAQARRFISDVDTSAEGQAVTANNEALMRGKLRPIPFRESSQENNLSIGTEPTSDSARARTASVFATALYSTLDASLQTIKIVIKGDPYWLFPRQLDANAQALPYKSKMSPTEALKIIKEAHKTYEDSVNLFGTDNFIIVRLRTPKVANDATGQVDPVNDTNNEIETFSGVYKVVSIVNKFESGKFTQELFCILDPVINLTDFLRDVENATKNLAGTSATPVKTLFSPTIMGQSITINPALSLDKLSAAKVDISAKLSKTNIPPLGQGIDEAKMRLAQQSKELSDSSVLARNKELARLRDPGNT